MPALSVIHIGRSQYASAWELQKLLWSAREQGRIGDCLVLTEHEHVYTLGKGADDNHLLASDQELTRSGAEVFRVDRGGDITYHGPGQIVGYPILDLNSYGTDIHRYLRNIEETLIGALAAYGIAGVREEGMTGVWVAGEKIAAIGVKVSRWITMHGFALNVTTDLQRFARIIPCGIFHKGVTSMELVLGRSVDLGEVRDRIVDSFGTVFGTQASSLTTDELLRVVDPHGTIRSLAVQERPTIAHA